MPIEAAIQGALVVPTDYEELTIGAAAVPLTLAKTLTADLVRVVHQDGPVRIRVDGTAPTAAVGEPVYDLETRWLGIREAARWQAIRTGSSNGIVRATYYKVR